MPPANLAYANKVRAQGHVYSSKFKKLSALDTGDFWHAKRYSVHEDMWSIDCDSDRLDDVSAIILADPRDRLVHDWTRRIASVDLHGSWMDSHDVSHEMSMDLHDERAQYLDAGGLTFSPTSASVDPVTDVSKVIEEASWILSQHTWDDDGNAQYQQATMDRAHDFLISLRRKAQHYLRRSVPLPAINPAGAGSVDIFWDLEGRQLLVNISADSNEPISFYGEDRFGTVVSGVWRLPCESDGVTELRQLDYLVTWLSSE